jgi:hypothetical protein
MVILSAVDTLMVGPGLAKGLSSGVDLVDLLHVDFPSITLIHLPNCIPYTTILSPPPNTSLHHVFRRLRAPLPGEPSPGHSRYEWPDLHVPCKELSLTYHDEQPAGIPHHIQLDTKETSTDRR